MELIMKKSIKAFICAAAASAELISAGSFGTLLSYAQTELAYDSADVIAFASSESESESEEETVTATTAAETTTAAAATTTVTTATTETAEETSTSATVTTAVEETTETTTTAVTDIPEEGWYTDESGYIYYYNADGTYLTGTKEIDGQKYIFSLNGTLKTGWRTIDGIRYYFDPVTGEAQYGWVEYEGNKFYVSQDVGKRTGYFSDSDGSSYVFDENGVMYSGNIFLYVDSAIYYAGENGKLLNEPTLIDGIPYVFASDGRLKTGWRTYEGKRYYYDPETGECVLGLLEYCGNYFYITAEDGKCTGVVSLDGIDYLFDEDTGCLQTGWQTFNDTVHYYYSDGTAAVGFTTISGKYYLFSDSGVMQTGWQTVDGATYYFDVSGEALRGWQTIGSSKYYFGSDYEMRTGLQTIAGKIYFFNSSGKMQTGWQTVSGSKYYFGSDGAALTGLQTISGSKYYFSSSGQMQTGWQTIDGNRYYFNTSTGIMAVNTTIDGYEIGSDGIASSLSAIQIRANEILASIGTSATNIYNYVRSNNKYKYIEETKTLVEIESIGWSYFANYAMDNRFVVCYYFAAITDVIFQQAGYETRIVYGTGRGTGDHYWNQIKVNGVWTNYDTCNGYADVTDDYLKSLNYTWTQYVYPEYN